MIWAVINNELVITVDKSLYTENVLFKCFYWYTGRYNVQIADKDSHHWMIKISGKTGGLPEGILNELTEKINRDLIDFKLRDIVNNETRAIRELLVAKAFAYYEAEENPVTDISDPVGFKPEDIIIDEQSYRNP